MGDASLIPTVVALSNFFVQNFPDISWYPYWYLGNPFNYLIGPVAPFSLLILNKAFFLPVSFAYFFLISLSFLIGASGLYVLLRSLDGEKRVCLISSILFLILPFSPYLLFYQNGLHHVTFGFLPWILLLFLKLIKNSGPKNAIFLSIAIAFVLLIDVSILLPLIVGFVALYVSLGLKRDTEDKAVKTVLITLLGVSLATVWYTPRFWWVLLANPSFGGVPLFNLIVSLFKFLLNLVPLVLAILLVKWRHFKPKGYMLFTVLFFSSFLFLSVVRFLSDPDFVMDWVGFSLELQFGGAIMLGALVQSSKFKVQNYNSKFKISNFKLQLLTFNFVLLTCLLILSILFDFWILSSMMAQNKNNYQERIVRLLQNSSLARPGLAKGGKRVFLSGSPVFFVNSFINIAQVRGGADQATIHPFWAHGVYQIREGEDPELTRNWLLALGASYILVHDKGSDEPFHDFKNTDKFADFKLILADRGDKLYKIEDSSIGRIASDEIVEVQKPKNGADSEALLTYVKTIKRPISSLFEKPNKIVVNGEIGENEVISLAVSYDPNWKIQEGQGFVLKDPIGNIIIKPQKQGEQAFVLFFSNSPGEFLLPVFFSSLLLLIMLRFEKIYPYFSRALSKLSLGTKGDEEEY